MNLFIDLWKIDVHVSEGYNYLKLVINMFQGALYNFHSDLVIYKKYSFIIVSVIIKI